MDIVQHAVIHPAVDRRSAYAKLLSGHADTDELPCLKGTEFGAGQEAAEVGLPEGARHAVVIRTSGPEQYLEHNVDGRRYLRLRRVLLAVRHHRQLSQALPQRPSTQLRQ